MCTFATFNRNDYFSAQFSFCENVHPPDKCLLRFTTSVRSPISAGIATVGQIMSILVKDKFLFTAVTLPADVDAALAHSQLSEVMKVKAVDHLGSIL
jgi:hypothetical protein